MGFGLKIKTVTNQVHQKVTMATVTTTETIITLSSKEKDIHHMITLDKG
jgi:hypothetical protein